MRRLCAGKTWGIETLSTNSVLEKQIRFLVLLLLIDESLPLGKRVQEASTCIVCFIVVDIIQAMAVSENAAWRELEEYFQATGKSLRMSELFKGDSQRFSKFRLVLSLLVVLSEYSSLFCYHYKHNTVVHRHCI